jgi:hypothetical protein
MSLWVGGPGHVQVCVEGGVEGLDIVGVVGLWGSLAAA